MLVREIIVKNKRPHIVIKPRKNKRTNNSIGRAHGENVTDGTYHMEPIRGRLTAVTCLSLLLMIHNRLFILSDVNVAHILNVAVLSGTHNFFVCECKQMHLSEILTSEYK